MKRILFSLLLLLTLVAFNPVFAADKSSNAAADANCCQTTCSSCLKKCEEMLKYCQKTGGKHASKEHIAAMKDCIALCRASSDLGSRDSKLNEKLREVCAEACLKCAKSCEDLNDPKLKDCVKMCNDCAKSCESGGAKCSKDKAKS